MGSINTANMANAPNTMIANSVLVRLVCFSFIIIIFFFICTGVAEGDALVLRGGLVGGQHAPLPRLSEPLLPDQCKCNMYARFYVISGRQVIAVII